MPTDNAAMLGVVPLVVNVGAAVLPTILAALASLAAMLLRPRLLVAACRRRPYVPVLLVALAAVGWWGGPWLWAKAPAGRGGPAGEGRIDWSRVAQDVLAARQCVAGVPSAVGAVGEAVFFRYDGSRCGYDGSPAPVGLSVLRTCEEPDAMFLSSPAVHGGKVFAASCILDVGVNYGTLFCLDAGTLDVLWKTSTIPAAGGKEEELKGFFSSPAVTADGRYVVIGQGLHNDIGCSLLCFRADTGKLHWRVPTPLHIEGSPAIRGDLAVAGAGAVEDKDGRPTGHRGLVLGVRISDGTVLWRCDVADPESSPVIAEDGVAYIGSGLNGAELVALRTCPDEDLKAGGLSRVLWRTKTPHPATGCVTLAGDDVLIGCGKGDFVFAAPDPEGVVMAFDRRTGRERWRVRMPDCVLGAIAVRGHVAICPVRNGEVVALDLSKAAQDIPDEQKILWRSRASGNAAVLAGPAFTGKHVYAVAKNGILAVLEAVTGRVLEKVNLNSPSRSADMGLSVSSPVIAGGRVYVGSETGGLRCLGGRALE